MYVQRQWTRGATIASLCFALVAGCSGTDELPGSAPARIRHAPKATPEQVHATLNALPYDDGSAGPAPALSQPVPAPAPSQTVLVPALPRPVAPQEVQATPARARAAKPAKAAMFKGFGPAHTLVLYDDTGPYAWLGEMYAVAAGNLASHFGQWTASPVAQYQAGDLAHATAAIYIGSTFDQPLPTAFLDDVLLGQRPVVWVYDNIWQLADRSASFASTYGFDPWVFDTSSIAEVVYKGTNLTRYEANGAGIMTYSSVDTTEAQVLALAVRSDSSTFPWAIRALNLTYVGENPFAFISEQDRYLAFCDLLFDALAPATNERHRAAVRIEDVSPAEDPGQLTAMADYLASAGVPFAISAIPLYVDPNGYYTGGVPETLRYHDVPSVSAAIQHMVKKGGTMVMHGYTHQYDHTPNPYTGVSGDDFEFFISHISPDDYVIYDGPVPEDAQTWVQQRINSGLKELADGHLPKPEIFSYPHYAGSALDSRTIRAKIPTAFHRGYYFGGALAGGPDDYDHRLGQFFPYTVIDVYDWTIIPEGLGGYEPEGGNHNPPRLAADILASAVTQLVIRDNVATFYFHPYDDLGVLQQIVEGIKAAGYTFVKVDDLRTVAPAMPSPN